MDKLPIQKIEVVKVKPKYVAQACPVCNSFGTLKHGTKQCQACEGLGYIKIPVDEMEGRNYGDRQQ